MREGRYETTPSGEQILGSVTFVTAERKQAPRSIQLEQLKREKARTHRNHEFMPKLGDRWQLFHVRALRHTIVTLPNCRL